MIHPTTEKRVFESLPEPLELPLYDILWADGTYEGSQHHTRLHLADRVVICSKPFEQLRPMFSDAFLFCLTNGAVNQLRIRSFEADQIVLDNGEALTVPPFLASKFREKYCRYLASLVWED